MKRKLAWVCLLVSPLVLSGAYFVLPRDPITQANCDKINQGMTLKEVEAILGKKSCWVPALSCQEGYVWHGKTGSIYVYSDRAPELEGALVRRVDFVTHENSQGLLEKIRDWLGL